MQQLEHILNWRRVDARITTSGQPNEAALAEIADIGVDHLVNLGPYHNQGALQDEPGVVADLGMGYTYIPVEFENPTDQDFERFCAALKALPQAKLHVHCIYNARVSAFFYRYAKMGADAANIEDAFQRMDSIWRPGNDWADFINQPEAKGQPNLYAGDDY